MLVPAFSVAGVVAGATPAFADADPDFRDFWNDATSDYQTHTIDGIDWTFDYDEGSMWDGIPDVYSYEGDPAWENQHCNADYHGALRWTNDTDLQRTPTNTGTDPTTPGNDPEDWLEPFVFTPDQPIIVDEFTVGSIQTLSPHLDSARVERLWIRAYDTSDNLVAPVTSSASHVVCADSGIVDGLDPIVDTTTFVDTAFVYPQDTRPDVFGAGTLGYGETLIARIEVFFAVPPPGSANVNYQKALGGGRGSVTLNVFTARTPGLSIVKVDEFGNDANDSGSPVVVTGGSVDVEYTITNEGLEPLFGVVVTDTIDAGAAEVTGMQCTFPGDLGSTAGVQDGSGDWSVTWANNADPDAAGFVAFAVDASFECVATVTGVTSDLHTNTGAVSGVGLTSEEEVDDDDPYNAVRGSVSVGDFVWFDEDHDGIQDDGDGSGIDGVVLQLRGPDGLPVTDVDGNPVGNVTTAGGGAYLFENLPILASGQSYTVTIVSGVPSGYAPTLPNEGGDTAVDSSTTSESSGDLTTDGAEDLTLDFGFWLPDPEISIVKVDEFGNDANDSGSPVVVTGGSV
ncbi:MAG: hypothetical protein KDB08_06975, partial [Microthrixaceae bacterium]|nr:hypothetical protein [Microthrixaceae bacterium]